MPDNEDNDLMKRMAELAKEMTAQKDVAPPPVASAKPPEAAPPPAEPAKGDDEMMKRMAQLAQEMAPPAAPAADDVLKRMANLAFELGPAPGVGAPPSVPPPLAMPVLPPAPALPPSPAPAPALPPVPAAAPAPVVHQSLDEVTALARELKDSLDVLKEAFVHETGEISRLLNDLSSRPVAAPPPPAPMPPPPPDPMPALEMIARSIADIKAMLGAELGARDKRIADLEAKLDAKPAAPAPAISATDLKELKRSLDDIKAELARKPPETVPALAGGTGLEEVADSVRDLQASMERLRENMKGDLTAAVANLKYLSAAQAVSPRPVLETPPALPVPGGAPPNMDALRQELLGPMAAMKAQLLDLTMSYHQISLRLAVLAAQEKGLGH